MALRTALAVEVALKAAFSVLKGGGLDVRFRHNESVGGDGVRLLEGINDLRLLGEDSIPVGDSDGTDVEGEEDMVSELDVCSDGGASSAEDPGPDDSVVVAAASASLAFAAFFFSSASFRCCSSCSSSDKRIASMTMSCSMIRQAQTFQTEKVFLPLPSPGHPNLYTARNLDSKKLVVVYEIAGSRLYLGSLPPLQLPLDSEHARDRLLHQQE